MSYVKNVTMLFLYLVISTAPDVYKAFMDGKCSVKCTPGEFNFVGTIMCLEQTINRSSKG